MGSMMSAYRGSYPYAGMMSGYLSNRGGGSASSFPGPGMMGYGYATSGAGSSPGWPTGAILAVAVLGGLLLAGVLGLALPRLRDRGGTPGTPAARRT
jgi:hypothetical protein